ncbi:MAG: hypothetical protein ACREMQ_07345 [Longimicrobiales bacterium]
MSAQEPDVVEANRLYWDTEDSVASIADRLDVSRRALYDAVQPLGAGVVCPSCGAQLSFENRSARKLGAAICRTCGMERQIDQDVNHDFVIESDAPAQAIAVLRGDSPADHVLDLRDPDLRHRAVVLGGAAIAGVAAGAMAAILAMRRD